MAAHINQLLRFVTANANRGFLLDCFVFILNLGAMSFLSRLFVTTVQRASDDTGAQNILFGMAIAMFVLAPLGATLKRWRHHQDVKDAREADPMGSCLFNPIFYFCLTALIFATVNAFLLERVYGRNDPRGDAFVISILAGLALMVTHTVLVYRYFSPPAREPRIAFLRSRAAALIGDVLLFANMVLFQLVWNLLTLLEVPHPHSLGDVLARTGFLLFIALLLYFPPRMFYLADDVKKRRTWIMVLLANLPVLVRVLVGTEPSLRW